MQKMERRMTNLVVNGVSKRIDVEPEMPLLWVLRDEMGLTGTKFGCGIAYCGACTVEIDGVATRSCVMPCSAVEGKTIRTIEGDPDSVVKALQDAWVLHQVPQCGYCQSGMIMSAAALLRATPEPTDADINTQITNICRCGTYQRIRMAIHTAARSIQGVKS
jgi:isoquinoline 1-oxidoreductase alpha subunit